MEPLVVIGAGGHSKVIADIIEEQRMYKIIGILDDKFTNEEWIEEVFYGPISALNRFFEERENVKLFIGIGDNHVRKKIVHSFQLNVQCFATLIHPSAIISSRALIKNGTAIMPNCIIHADAVIGSHSIINSASIIEHDSVIGDFAHISPNATLTGGVKIGEGTQVGASATVIPNIQIGNWSIIGAGSVVIHSIPANAVAAGVPAKVKNKVSMGGV